MNMNQKNLVALCMVLVVWFMAPMVSADTQTVPLAVLKEGTNQTSYAASYFANSASVTSSGDGTYLVTSTITTNKSLGNYPVQMLSINGGAANTVKSDNGQSQTITYSFQTSDLKVRHQAVIKVDVDSINYHHTYDVGLQLDTTDMVLPKALAVDQSVSTKKASPAPSTQTAHSNDTENNKVMSTKTDNQVDIANSDATSESENLNESADASTKEKVTSKAADKQTATSQKNHINQKNAPVQKNDLLNQIIMFIGGGLSVGIITAVGVIWFAGRKK